MSNGTFNVASTAGWQVLGGYSGYVGEFRSAQGGARGDWVALGGSFSQTLNTISGQRYLLSFATRGDDPQQSPRKATMRVSWDGQLIGSYTFPNNGRWLYPKFLLTADGPTNLRFETAYFLEHPDLDDVVVVPAPLTHPQITLTSPADGATFAMNDDVPLRVDVAPGQGRSISRVDYFHSGTTSIVSSATAPYDAVWTNVPPGSWYVSAQVRDNTGEVTTAILKQIHVVIRPTVNWLSPSDRSVLTVGENVPLSAVVTNNDGRMTRLVFRVDDTIFAEFNGPIANSVYTATWSNAPRGNFRLSATGYYSDGVTFSTAQSCVSVLPSAVLDQEQSFSSSGVWLPLGTIYAQTFTPAINGELHHINLALFPNHFEQVFPVNVTVVETVQGMPTGPVLAQIAIPNVSQSGETETAYFRGAGPILRAGVLYAFIISPTFQTNGVTLLTAYTDDPYPRGAIWRKQGTGPWLQAEREPNLYADMLFATYMSPKAAPTVSISNPTQGAQFFFRDSVPVSAVVMDADSTSVTVQFFAGGIPIGTDAEPPYAIVWSNAPAGDFPLTAIATDELGFSSQSAPVEIHIEPTNGLPHVSILDANVAEGGLRTNQLVLRLVLSAVPTNDVTVEYATADGTATAGSDYEAARGRVTFPAGITNATLAISIYGDQVNESDESFLVNVLAVSGANFGRVQAIATIRDDELGAGKIHHFAFTQIASPQTTNRPFFVGITALDVSNGVVTNFSGEVSLSFLSAPTDLGHTLLDGVPHTTTPDTGGTLGYAFTPSTNLLVTGIRHYAGYYMSIWTDDGVLLVKHELPRTAGWWVDSTLAAPVALKAGKPYRIAFYTGGLTWYGIAGRPTNFLHGTFGSAFQRTGEGFPEGNAPSSWPLADIRYRLDTPLSVPVSPDVVNFFSNGRWTGLLNFDAVPASRMQLRAEDEFSHIGLSEIFTMNQSPAVQIVSPGSNTLIFAPVDLTINADAVDPDGSIVRVEFFGNGIYLGARSSTPYTIVWSNLPPGEHTISVRALDNFGAIVSASSGVRVLAPFSRIATIRFDPPAIPGGSRSITQWIEHGFTFSSGAMSHTDSPTSSGGRPQGNGGFLQTTHLILVNEQSSPFSLISMDLAEYSTVFPSPFDVSVQGVRVDGTTVYHTFTTDGVIDGIGILADFQNFTFPPEFSFLVRVEMSSAFPSFSLENLRVAADFPGAPRVHMTSPVNQSAFSPLDVVLEATALSSTGRIHRVDFLVDGDFVGSAFDVPFRLPWPYLAPGTHSVTAKAFDGFGLEAASDPVTFHVTAKPIVNLIAPTNGAVVTVGEPATLQAHAVDEDGTIAQVIFFDGTNTLGTVTNAPFWLTWSNVAAGVHSLYALAIDNLGVTGVSASIQVIANIPPSVSLNSPSNQIVLQLGEPIHFSAAAQDADGTISFVEFYLGTNLIGRVLSPPYELDWISTNTGPFCATAVAEDNYGAARSDRMGGRVNQPPRASILVPTPQSSFIAPATIPISGFAEDIDGRVRTLFVSAGAGVTATFDIGEKSTVPLVDCGSLEPATPHKVSFTCVWSNVPPGVHTIRAHSVDSDGASSAIAETTLFSFNYPPVAAEWVGTNVIRRPPAVRFIQRVTLSNPTGDVLPAGQLLVHLDRHSILRGVRVMDGTRIRRGVFSIPVPDVPAFGAASVEIQYVAPNRRRIPEPLLVPVIR